MPATIKVNNEFKSSYHQVKINGTWKSIPQIYIKQNNQWKPLYSYNWQVGEWSKCSVECGGGTQTRSVKCKREDGTYWPDSVCSQIGTKPISSQACNTQTCSRCSSRSTRDGNFVLVYDAYVIGGREGMDYCYPDQPHDFIIVVDGYYINSPVGGVVDYGPVTINGVTYSRGNFIRRTYTLGIGDDGLFYRPANTVSWGFCGDMYELCIS